MLDFDKIYFILLKIKLINNIDELTIINYEDKQVLSYFSKSLKNEYIRLSKKMIEKKVIRIIIMKR